MKDESSELIARKSKYALDKGLSILLCSTASFTARLSRLSVRLERDELGAL